MATALLIARLLLAAVFLVAGLAKLADLAGSRQALRDFGVPGVLAHPFGLLLPLAELVVAVALVPSTIAWWGALGALALLLLFVIGIAFNLARGRTPDCHCFGQLHSAPAGWPTLIRNLVLAAVAGFVVGFGWSSPDPGLFDWFAALSVPQRIEVFAGVLVFALLLGGGWLLFQVMAQQGRLLLRLEALEAQMTGVDQASVPSAGAATVGLPVGTSAPSFALSTLTGEMLTLHALRALGKPIVLLFSAPGCGPCNALLPAIGLRQRHPARGQHGGLAGIHRPHHDIVLMHIKRDETRGFPRRLSHAMLLSFSPPADGRVGQPRRACRGTCGQTPMRARRTNHRLS